jgi:hypothetical protein
VFGSARAVQAGALAAVFAAQGVGVRCRLADNEPAGLASVEATEVASLADGTRGESGPWQASRPKAPRPVVRGGPAAGKPWVSGGTPQGKAALEARAWPGGDRARHAMQALRCKGMSDHGGLDRNDGRKTLLGPDRPQRRPTAHRAQALETASKRVAKQAEAVQGQPAQVAASTCHGQSKRLAQRPRAWVTVAKERKDAKAKPAPRSEPVAAWGPVGPRAARACRKPTRMTLRTLWLEHPRRACRGARGATLHPPGSLEQVWSLLCARSGARTEPPSQLVYWIKTAGVALANRRLLHEIVAGLCALDLQDQSKQIHMRLKDMPP